MPGAPDDDDLRRRVDGARVPAPAADRRGGVEVGPAADGRGAADVGPVGPGPAPT
ncbi:MAG TPA: hypothetical protein VHM89_15025 [Acidimicrobiales bacterium]|nr:hypothetical protein [Acidimicrobiales bacterium]